MSVQKFRKRPVEIEAIRLDLSSDAGIREMLAFVPHPMTYPNRPYIEIKTLEGVMRANEGDWIIKGVQGEFYPCKPDIFEATYEAVS